MLVCRVGFEPTTYRLRGGRSTAELPALILVPALGFEPNPAHSQWANATLTPQPGLLVRDEGFEPSASAVQVRHSNQAELIPETWLEEQGSNLQPPGSKPGTLPVELSSKIRRQEFGETCTCSTD